jgi:hypothetical protein
VLGLDLLVEEVSADATHLGRLARVIASLGSRDPRAAASLRCHLLTFA